MRMSHFERQFQCRQISHFPQTLVGHGKTMVVMGKGGATKHDL